MALTMEISRHKINQYFEKKLNDLNEAVSGANALVPWLDLPLFMKEFVRALCIYFVVRSGFVVSICVVLYHTLSANGGDLWSGPANPKSKITLSMVYEFIVSFVIQYSFVLVLYLVPFPSLVFLTFVRVALDSYLFPPKFLDEKLLLEKLDDERLSGVLQRLGTQVPNWLSTPDHQRVEWLNKILKQLWPHIGNDLEDMVEDFIDKLKPKLDFKVENLVAGSTAPRISSVNVREQDEDIFLDVSILYGGDFSGRVKWFTGVEFEIDQIQIQADVQIELKNFVGHKPFVGTVVVHMDKAPSINPKFKKMASVIESYKPIKKALLDCVQNAVKSCFPYPIVLVREPVENLIEDLDGPQAYSRFQSQKKTSSSAKSVNNAMWNLINTKFVHEETTPSKIVTYLQDHTNHGKRLSDPSLGGKQMVEEVRLLQSKDSQKKSSSTNVTKSVERSPMGSLTKSDLTSSPLKYQVTSAPPLTNSSSYKSHNVKDNGYTIGSPSSESLGSQDVSYGSQSFRSSQGLEMASDLRGLNKAEEEMTISDFRIHTKYPDAPDSASLRSSSSGSPVSSETVQETTVEGPRKKWDGGLRAAIARDVESSQITQQERVSLRDDDYNDPVESEEMVEPFTLVSREGLTGLINADAGQGCVEITTSYETPNILAVTVHRARNLPKKGGRIPNPYVKLHLQDEELKQLVDISTHILDNTQDPVFEKKFEFQLEKPLSAYTLKVSTKTKHKLAHHLGQVVLCFAPYRSQMVKERNWYDLADSKKDHVMCWVGYRELPSDHRITRESDEDDLERLSLQSEETNEYLV